MCAEYIIRQQYFKVFNVMSKIRSGLLPFFTSLTQASVFFSYTSVSLHVVTFSDSRLIRVRLVPLITSVKNIAPFRYTNWKQNAPNSCSWQNRCIRIRWNIQGTTETIVPIYNVSFVPYFLPFLQNELLMFGNSVTCDAYYYIFLIWPIQKLNCFLKLWRLCIYCI